MKKHFFTPSIEKASRRQFLRKLSLGVGTTALGLHGLSAMAGIDPNPSAKTLKMLQSGRKLGIALVGLGEYSEDQLAPALQETKLCKLSGIVTGTPDKIDKWKNKYDIPDQNVYNYENFDSIADNDDIDIIYVVLPNAMHAEYTIRAARAGKHVICEKPMATSVNDCQAMIEACEEANVKLSIGYRLHFEPYNQEMMRLGQEEVYGQVKKIRAENGMENVEKGVWRLDKELAGGGPLPDVGVYCIQGAIYTKGEVPVSVTAQYEPVTDEEKFNEVEEGISWQMQFEDGLVADCKTSYSEDMSLLRAETDNEWFELDPAYPYEGIKGETSQGEMDFPQVNQQALQMDDFADCIINNKSTRVPGEMGLRDVSIIYAIYEAANTGEKVMIEQEARAYENR